MLDVLTIAGSPSHTSRSAALLDHVRTILEANGLVTAALHVRDLDAHDLLTANSNGATIRSGLALVQQARAVVIATPVYKAAYAGVLKAFLDLLPQDGLADKIVLPLATGASLAHLLAIDYALKPVLAALGAQQILKGIYVQDAQIQLANGGVELDSAIAERLHSQLHTLTRWLGRQERTPYVLALN